jgi:hypothetical protein
MKCTNKLRLEFSDLDGRRGRLVLDPTFRIINSTGQFGHRTVKESKVENCCRENSSNFLKPILVKFTRHSCLETDCATVRAVLW